MMCRGLWGGWLGLAGVWTATTAWGVPGLREPAGCQDRSPPQDKGHTAPPTRHEPLVPYPHPLITEVLYAVPAGARGDASGDGTRDAIGDEFIEIVNPHERAIRLGGYVLTGRPAADRQDPAEPDAEPNRRRAPREEFRQMRFVFPACELNPGQVAVVFNGRGQTWQGPVGGTHRAPERGNERFHGALVFTMGATSMRTALANRGDMVLLTAPDGTKVQCITWGDPTAPDGCLLAEEAPMVGSQSVARRDAGAPLEPHPVIAGRPFSPGIFPGFGERSGTSPPPPLRQER